MPRATSRASARAEPAPEVQRARILDAATAIIDEKGSAGLTMRGIATRAGMPTMTVYGYFPSKTAIIRSLWSLAFDPLFAEMRAVEDSIDDPRQRLREVALTYVNYWISFPDRYRMVFLIEDRREEKPGDSWFIDETEVIESYLRFAPLIGAARGQSHGDFSRDAEALICALTGVAHMLVTVSEYPWASPSVYVDLLIRGAAQAHE